MNEQMAQMELLLADRDTEAVVSRHDLLRALFLAFEQGQDADPPGAPDSDYHHQQATHAADALTGMGVSLDVYP